MAWGAYKSNNKVFDALMKMGPVDPVLLSNPDPDFYKKLKSSMPASTRFFLKVWVDDVVWMNYLNDPFKGARDFATLVISQLWNLPGIAGILTLNETPLLPEYFIVNYDIFQMEFLDIIKRQYNIPVIGMNYGVGNPQVSAATGKVSDNPFTRMYSRDRCNFIGLHLYSPPGVPMDGAGKEWFDTRIEFIDKDIKAVTSHVTQYVATEAGYSHTNDGQKGWKSAYLNNPEEYMRQLKWFDTYMRDLNFTKNIHFDGFCIFGLFGDGSWSDFDLVGSPLPKLIGDYNKGLIK